MNGAGRAIGAEASLLSLVASRVSPAAGRAAVRPSPARAGEAARLGASSVPASQTLSRASTELWTPGSAGCSVGVPASSQPLHSLLAFGPRSGVALGSRVLNSSGADRDYAADSRGSEDVFRAPPSMVVGEPPVPSTSGGGQDNKEFYLQCGVAVRTLREEVPKVFEHDLTYDIYREDITFIDHISSLPSGIMVTHGKESYRRLMWSVRFHGTLFLSAINVRILRIWQPREKTISVRWSISGNPRVLHSLGAAEVHLDGISEYALDSQGMIYEHKIESVDWNANQSTLKALNMFPAPRNMTPSFFFHPFRAGSALESTAAAASASAGGAPAASTGKVGELLRMGLHGLDAGRGGRRGGGLSVQ